MPSVLKNADKIIANSYHTEKIIHQYYHFTKKKTAVTYLAAKQKINDFSNEVETLNNLKINKPYFLFIGTLEPRKNLKTLIAAYQKLEIENKPKLVLAGKKGWIENETYLIIKNNSNIIETGFVSDEVLATLYKNALAFVFPTYYEGFGLPLLEAMQYNCPEKI